MKQSESQHLIQRLDIGLGWVEKAFALAAGYGAMLITGFGCAEVIGRRIFNSPIKGTLDIIEVSMVLVALAGMALTQSQAGHIRMTLIVSFFKNPRARTALDFIAYFFGTLLIGALIVTCSMHAWNIFQRGGGTSQLYIPYWIAGVVISLSLLMLFLRLALQSAATLRLLIWPDAEPYGLPVPAEVAAVPAEV